MLLPQVDLIHAHLPQRWGSPRCIPPLQVSQVDRPHSARSQPELPRHLPRRSHFTSQPHGVLKSLRKGSLTRQQRHLLTFHSAVRTLDPMHLHKHRRRKSTPRQIANRPLAGVIDLCQFPPATATLQPSVPSFAPYPQLQRLRLLVNLVLINPIPGPVQNPGELTIRRQSAILADIKLQGSRAPPPRRCPHECPHKDSTGFKDLPAVSACPQQGGDPKSPAGWNRVSNKNLKQPGRPRV